MIGGYIVCNLQKKNTGESKVKKWSLIVINIIFYLLLLLDAIVTYKWGEDYIVLVGIYIFLASSTFLLERALRDNIILLKKLSFADVIVRVGAMLLYLTGVYSDMIRYISWCGIVVCFCINSYLQVRIYNVIKKKSIPTRFILSYSQIVTQFKEVCSTSNEHRKEIEEMQSMMQYIEKRKGIVITIWASFYINFILASKNQMVEIILIIIELIIFYIFVKLQLHAIYSEYLSKNNVFFACASAILGCAIIYMGTVIQHNSNNYINISIWMLGIIFWSPYINESYLLKEQLNNNLKNIMQL